MLCVDPPGTVDDSTCESAAAAAAAGQLTGILLMAPGV